MSAEPVRQVELSDGSVAELRPDGTVDIRDNAETNVGYARLTPNEVEDLADLAPALALEGQR